MRYAVESDKGKQRSINEDSYNVIAGYPGIPVVFIVADGMGGHNSGEVASKTAVDFINNYILNNPDLFADDKDISESIKEVIIKSNKEVINKAKEKKKYNGMGTTIIIAVIKNNKVYFGHVGDSRVYLVRNDELNQITTDHSYIEELVLTGSLTREEAQNHPGKNLITRALGSKDDIEVDTYICKLQNTDTFIICTDGFYNMIEGNVIIETLEKTEEPEEICKEFVNYANEKGGEDNITVLVFKQ